MRTLLWLVLVLLVCSVLVLVPDFAVKAEPNTIVVPDDYSTIQEAINNAVDGDTVFVKSGVYYEYLVVNKSISLVGENKETTTVFRGNQSYPNVYATVVVRNDGVNITGFTIKNELAYPTQINIEHFPGAIKARTGLHLISVCNCSIFGNIITDSGYGIWLYDSQNNSISDNNITNSNHGILLHYSLYNFVRQNTVTRCSLGLALSSASFNTFRDNNLMNSSRNFGVSGNSIVHYSNDVDSSNLVNGKRLYYLSNLTNQDINGPNFPEAGLVYVVNCNEMTFRNLDVSNDFGFFLFNTTNSTLTCNNISNSLIGIGLKSCSGIILSENFLSSITGYGIRIESSKRVVVEKNSIVKTRSVGVDLKSSDYNNISRNVLEEIVGHGIHLEACSSNSISCNELTNCEFGITLLTSPENRIESNKITSHEFETANLTCAVTGIWLVGKSNRTKIVGNTIVNCERGILFDNSLLYDNYVAGNNITDCNIGLQLKGFRSAFVSNTVSNSKEFAVAFPYGMNNVFYNNNFINNSQQVNPITVNFWDNEVNGNYWSDYNGTDIENDGVGDTPYIIDDRNQDNYPLMVPVTRFDVGTWEWNNYYVDLISNSDFSNFVCNPELDASLTFDIHGVAGTPGFCRLTITKDFMESENWVILMDGEPVLFTSNEDQQNTYLNFTYTHNLQTIEIIGSTAIPEFSSWLVLVFFVVVIVFGTKIGRRLK